MARFDIDQPALPDVIDAAALTDGDYPYDKRLAKKPYRTHLHALQIELLKMQRHVQAEGIRVVCVFEGRDAAGKGGCIRRVLEHLNKRHARSVALSKPTEAERGQWYFQRYVHHLPTAGDLVLFDRSWYNRAGVERVMGFCNDNQLADFLREAPQFEGMLVRDDIRFLKFFLKIGRATQLARFHARRHDPLKTWKLSPIDLEAMSRWDQYADAYADMFRFTHTQTAPWTVIAANDKRRARLAVIQSILHAADYPGKDPDTVGEIDANIVSLGDGLVVA